MEANATTRVKLPFLIDLSVEGYRSISGYLKNINDTIFGSVPNLSGYIEGHWVRLEKDTLDPNPKNKFRLPFLNELKQYKNLRLFILDVSISYSTKDYNSDSVKELISGAFLKIRYDYCIMMGGEVDWSDEYTLSALYNNCIDFLKNADIYTMYPFLEERDDIKF